MNSLQYASKLTKSYSPEYLAFKSSKSLHIFLASSDSTLSLLTLINILKTSPRIQSVEVEFATLLRMFLTYSL